VTELTCRPDKGPHREGWLVYFGDICVGHIGLRTGVPVSEPQWGWACGFYPGCDHGQQANGTGETFDEARAGFEEAWNRLRATRTEAHFELWRQTRLHRMEIPDAREGPEAADSDEETTWRAASAA
jgi:hypothetical protein